MPERVFRHVQIAVAERAAYRCEYCLSAARCCPDSLSIEHIIPRSKGGADDESNLALACQGCNNRKFVSIAAPDPTSAIEVPLFHPRYDQWSDPFVWNDDGTRLIGVSAVWRATVERLELNRAGVVNLRRILRLEAVNESDSMQQ